MKRFNDIVTITTLIVLQWLQWFQSVWLAALTKTFPRFIYFDTLLIIQPSENAL